MDHPHSILYGNSKPNTSIFMLLTVSPNENRELKCSQNTHITERPKGMIITPKRLQEIIQIKERPANKNAPLANSQTEEIKILRTKLVELHKTEHLAELINSEKQLQEKEKEITEFRMKINTTTSI